MALGLPPPPIRPTRIRYKTLPADYRVCRIYKKDLAHPHSAITFRMVEKGGRFDHHVPSDPKRGILYAGLALGCCLTEVFGDQRYIEYSDRRLGELVLTRSVKLLDLVGGAMKNGVEANISAVYSRSLTQAWSRYFYDDPDKLYGAVDGLWYRSSHNSGYAMVFYERAAGAISCPESSTTALGAAGLRARILRAAERYGLLEEAPPPAAR